MRVLALDFGGTTGFAVGGTDGLDVSGTWDIRPRRGDSPGMRYVYLRKRLEETLGAYPDLGLVVYEQSHMRGGAATAYAMGCEAVLQAWCAERGLEHASVHSATLKKYATGKGHASKEEMMTAAKAKGWEFSDDNESDALHLLDYALEMLL